MRVSLVGHPRGIAREPRPERVFAAIVVGLVVGLGVGVGVGLGVGGRIRSRAHDPWIAAREEPEAGPERAHVHASSNLGLARGLHHQLRVDDHAPKLGSVGGMHSEGKLSPNRGIRAPAM